jgi:uncharacterized protein (TIGR00369 family)
MDTNTQAEQNLNFFEHARRGEFPAPPFMKLLEMEIAEVGDGRVVFTLTPREELYNGIGLVHGGVAATLMDSAIGCAIATRNKPGEFAVTLDLQVRYFRPITEETGTVRCEGTVINMSRNYATGEARIIDSAGKLYGHATSTYAIRRK